MDLTKDMEAKGFNNFTEYFVIASFCNMPGHEEWDKEIWKRPFDITMQFNGHEINPRDAIKAIHDQMERMVKEEAKKIVQDLKRDVIIKIEDKGNELFKGYEKMIEDMLPEEYREKEDDWD